MIKKGTDRDIFQTDEKTRIAGMGRPKVNRELAYRLILAEKYTTHQIAMKLDCSDETVRRIKRDMRKEGILENKNIIKTRSLTEADFDEECINAMGISFLKYMMGKQVAGKTVFNFCKKCWQDPNVWNKPSLVLVRDQNSMLGDQLAIKWLSIFQEFPNSIRSRKKTIRQLFTFLRREDINKRFLTMRKSRDPINIKRIPEISFSDFPIRFNNAIQEMTELNPLWGLFIKSKLVFGARTGEQKRMRGMIGLKKGTGNSYIIFRDKDNYQCHIQEKANEEWDITFIPKLLRHELFDHVETIKRGEFVFNEVKYKKTNSIIPQWKKVSKYHTGVEFDLHAIRKVNITWLYACKVPMDVGVDINVGWKDLNTAKTHYMHNRDIMKKSQRLIYYDNIPEWYKDGVEEYVYDE